MQNIVPFLWFDGKAEEAARFYVSLFPNSKIDDIGHYGDEGLAEEGSVMTVSFQLNGQEFMALNGGPEYSFTPAVSFMVSCETQAEVDHFWDKLVEGGKPVQCGWLTDKYGLSWQIVPTILGKLMSDPDREKAGRVTKAMLQMVKLDVDALQRAYDGVPEPSAAR
jgi:predicted 3-demethylubiquinone-9 3-methyltransferase (glyoxalase superfamily)